MLIETLAKLANDAGADRISLEISPSDGGECQVMVVTSFGQGVGIGKNKEAARVLAALTQPLVVAGNVGELDRKLVALVDDLDQEFVAAAKTLPETDVQKRKRELRASVQNDKKQDDADANGDGDKTGGSSQAAEAATTDHAEALAAGDADTL